MQLPIALVVFLLVYGFGSQWAMWSLSWICSRICAFDSWIRLAIAHVIFWLDLFKSYYIGLVGFGSRLLIWLFAWFAGFGSRLLTGMFFVGFDLVLIHLFVWIRLLIAHVTFSLDLLEH